MIKFTAACAQFAITPMQPRENVQKAVHWIERAVRETNARLGDRARNDHDRLRARHSRCGVVGCGRYAARRVECADC